VTVKGIILAGGTGSRLHPVTLGISKQLLPIYDKPMVYYPLATLMLAGIRDIALVSTPTDLPNYQRLLGDGRQWGISIGYLEQPRPEGIAQALIIGRQFIADDRCALILGDNVFYGHGLPEILRKAAGRDDVSTIFGYRVRNPGRYGVVDFDAGGRAVAIEEKPPKPKSHFAVTGLYFYTPDAVDMAASLKPSARGELEISDLNQRILDRGELEVELLGRGIAWLDTGTHQSIREAATFIEAIENRQGLKVCCPEEIAFRSGFIANNQLQKLAAIHNDTDYGRYLTGLLEDER
jgi:glucose-1-phosphate thymidylyltransferase